MPTSLDYSDARPAKAFTIPFDYRNDFIVVTARLNGLFAVELLFDTGSEHTVITEPLLFPALNTRAIEPIRIVGSDLSTSIDAVLSRRNHVTVGELALANQPIIAVSDPALDLAEVVGDDIAGILGVGAFGAYVIEIDYRREVIRLTPPDRFRPPSRAARLPIARSAGKSYVTVATRVHAAYADSLRYLIDTGAALDALLFAAPADSSIYPPQIVAGVIGHGLGGRLRGFVGRTDTIYIPDFPLSDIVTHFQVLPGDTARAPGAAFVESVAARNGIIGNGILRRFHVAIDGPGGHVYLSPRSKPPKPSPYDRSGLTLVVEPERRGTTRVQFVAPGTPAALAGIRAGDLVRKVDGWPVRLLSTAAVRRRLRRSPGRTVTLQIERSGVTFEAKLRLRDLI